MAKVGVGFATSNGPSNVSPAFLTNVAVAHSGITSSAVLPSSKLASLEIQVFHADNVGTKDQLLIWNVYKIKCLVGSYSSVLIDLRLATGTGCIF